MKYAPKYGLIIICKNEAEQESLYNKLIKQGIKIRVVCV